MSERNLPIEGNWDLASAILLYNRAHHQPTWVVHVRPGTEGMPFPGTSAKLISFNAVFCEIEIANGDREQVRTETLHFRVAEDF